ncbi:hypothetical protein OC846_006104 [Tilletia horrida]|uniref:Uncharacterized protein n=1 Tax=Tilletia horrida TaxID=155126 RepID=A0AAN6GJ99_9BASI|nr:hypothetical protein OC846_006104 [Tilletia horrida]KAK0561245.1 hypothetical protein OC861_005912 [Tilletia horrida]
MDIDEDFTVTRVNRANSVGTTGSERAEASSTTGEDLAAATKREKSTGLLENAITVTTHSPFNLGTLAATLRSLKIKQTRLEE